jgi:Mn-dependent DtxR family transcriptional regulator
MSRARKGKEKDIFSGKAKDILLSLYESPKYLAELTKDIGGAPFFIIAKLEDLKREGLIEDKYIQTKRIISLTEKGIEVAKFIKLQENLFKKPEIEEVKEIPKDRKKWILLLLHLANEIKGITRFMKYLFLMKKEYEINNEYNFIPYSHGPCSFEVFEDLEKLERMGLIEIEKKIHEPKIAGDWQIVKKFKLTEKGKEVAEKIYNELDNVTKVKLNELIERFGKYTFAGLLRYVYEKYPEECKEVE